MIINKKICTEGISNNPNRPLKAIEYITIHCTGNYSTTATAKSHANYLYGGSGGNQTSWHYTVDKDEIWQSFEDISETWHAGDGSDGPGNYTSIGIEICVNDRPGFSKACDKAAWLASELLKKYSIPIEKVVQHNKWTGKNCPSEIRSGAWGVTWEDFLTLIRQYYIGTITKTPIIGDSTLSSEQLTAFLLKNNSSPKINCTAAELASLYIYEGNIEGIRGDIAFCQAIHETGWFKYGGVVNPEQNNFAGIGALNNNSNGQCAVFDTPQIGVRAQIQHLKAYACKDMLVKECVDPRFKLVTRGIAPCFEDLGGRWAVPGYDAKIYSGFDQAYSNSATYGQKVLSIYESAKNVKADKPNTDKSVILVIAGDTLIVPAENVEGNWVMSLADGTKVKLRDVLFSLGYDVMWDAVNKTITAVRR